MREFLEDANQHRDDGYGRAQAHVKQQLPKRFYTTAAAARTDGGFAATLDGRVPKTPGMKPVVVPNQAIAAALAEEWGAQNEFIDPETMPLVRLVNSAVEAGPEAADALRAEIVKYAGNDLLLYRVDHPAALVRRQEEVWDDALVKLARQFGVSFRPTLGIVHQPQPAAMLAKLDAVLSAEDYFVLAALNAITSITGSGLLALALRHGLLGPEQVWIAAHLDEDFNVSQWGEVEEITVRRAKRRKEFDAAVKLIELLSH
jgi:chaperone required for assembly of F1-ATPase